MSNKIENISVVGVGKLGLCLSLNLENSGFNVLGCDINKDYIKSLNEKIFISDEPKVTDLLQRSKNINFTTVLGECILFSDVIFLMVATPSSEDGKYNHHQIEKVLKQIYSFGKQNNKKTIIIGCTTFPGYCETLVDNLKKLNYDLVYNPEFIAQGNIINGQLYPDMVLIGESSKDSGNIVESIHSKVCLNKPTICRMSLTEAELTKLSINCFVTTKISFANMIGDVCNKLNISHEKVLNSIGSDSRIGNKYLSWGYGFGGPCFPRDNRALGILCSENDIEPTIPTASDRYNSLHNDYHVDFLCKNEVINNKITFNGISYKKGSILIEESQQLEVAKRLSNLGIEVTLIDNEKVLNQVKEINGDKFKYINNNDLI
jgi:UDPglucose 6-dehydrogenase